jgi:aspartyl/glutamyl-tRNA(Asn/Gln) amidotransferase C subunit
MNHTLSGTNGIISETEVQATADLSELELGADELLKATAALAEMLEHFEIISQVRTDERELRNPVENRFRLDDCRPDLPRTSHEMPTAVPSPDHALLEAAPDFEDAFFFVPRIK